MKRILILLALTQGLWSCQQGTTTKETPSKVPGVHKGVAIDKMNTTKYTYLLLDENGTQNWVALPLTDVPLGETYYYANEMVMTNFTSKELGKVFEKVYFINGVYADPLALQASMNQPKPDAAQANMPANAAPDNNHAAMKNMKVEKAEVKVNKPTGGMSIGELFQNMSTHEGKTVKVRGSVSKYSEGIMDRNWVHIQDGSEFNGKYDLTLTTNDQAELGKTYTFEGTVTLNKDFGAGYKYDLIIENARILK